ncbi:hypothetical protein Pflav_012640 [Phytohabitans flavus]|uniref:Uncharacterized protein n=1 Tax=Phytohabitans flavus TaxID=1076124 RepID=A0A6F8XM01_9ACTN|nr:hypothetical protein Pflav_012640 [Phytohabitans flavus]
MPDDLSTDTVDILAIDQSVITSTGSAGFGITASGFVAKPYARLLAEKLATARALLGDDLDLTGGSVIRKLLEVTALEDARTWAALASWYDNSFVVSATGAALDRLGEELGLPRPHEVAHGQVTLTLATALPDDVPTLTLPEAPACSPPADTTPRWTRPSCCPPRRRSGPSRCPRSTPGPSTTSTRPPSPPSGWSAGTPTTRPSPTSSRWRSASPYRW